MNHIFSGTSTNQYDVACCWAHVRHRLVKTFDIKAEELLKLIRTFYRIEHEAKCKAEAKGTETALFQFCKGGAGNRGSSPDSSLVSAHVKNIFFTSCGRKTIFSKRSN